MRGGDLLVSARSDELLGREEDEVFFLEKASAKGG